MPQVDLTNIVKKYSAGAEPAVKRLDLTIGDGEFMCLLGPSGCGKTTTLRMIAGLEHPTEGRITIGEEAVDDVSRSVYVPSEKRELGLVFQSYALWPHLSIRKNVEFGLELRKVPKAERAARATEVMEKLNIAQYEDRFPSELSGGQQQRVALARTLAVNPGVLLLDEPLSNLDSRLRLEMRAELSKIHQEYRTTVVFVTHDQWEAMTLATTIAVMSEGLLQQVGAPDEIYSRPANRFVAEFVGNPPINIIELDGEADARTALARRYLETVEIASVGSLGFRPESIRLTDPDLPHEEEGLRGTARISAILPTGGSWIVELNVDGAKIFATTSVPVRRTVGSEVGFFVETADVHHFDHEGDRVEIVSELQTVEG